jgi:hypothetical protein
MSQEYGSATIDGQVNKRDGRAYQEPIGASTVEVAGSNELLNGCIGTRLSKVIKAADLPPNAGKYDDNIALGTKGSAQNNVGTPVICYWVQSASAAAAGATGLINTTTWTWTAGAGTDTITAAVAVGDRMWAGVAIIAAGADTLVIVEDEEDDE